MADTEVIHLAGREFHGVDQGLTMAQNDFVLSLLDEIGTEEPRDPKETIETASDIVAKIARGDKSDGIAQRLLRKILKSGRASDLLAGLLTEKGKRWTRSDALRNAEMFADIRDSDAQIKMRNEVVSFVFGFFLSGEASSKTSPKSSSQNEKAPGTSNGGVAISGNSPESSDQ
jgi:hypothetical protein